MVNKFGLYILSALLAVATIVDAYDYGPIPFCGPCGKYIPGKCEDGTYCAIEGSPGSAQKCVKRVEIGESCAEACKKCKRGSRCTNGICTAVQKENVGCGRPCEKDVTVCRTGLSCLETPTFGYNCVNEVGTGERCNARCKICKSGNYCDSYSNICIPSY